MILEFLYFVYFQIPAILKLGVVLLLIVNAMRSN